MPAHPPTAPNDPPARGILLLEEYDALGVAIAAALRKFAPLHAVRVAHNFAAAEAAALAMKPELFVLDLDPPPRGEVAFFNKLQKQFPDARVLILAAGISRELRSARGTAGAIQFIEKQFDLAEFGAAVQALLGRWAVPASTSLRGTLRDLHVLDIIHLKCLTLGTAVVRVTNPQGRTGEIHFRRGQIRHATAGVLTGVPAFEEIVGWPRGGLSEAELPADAAETIARPWVDLLLPAMRRAGESGRANSLGAKAAQPAAPSKGGKKILVIDDTEMLLIFVADVLATADQTFQIMTASTGSEGIRLAATTIPDLVLLDYSLTDINGDEVCRALLANEATARIPVLMMSGHLTEMATTAQSFGNVVATLAKPFLSGAVINAVEKVLAAGPLPKSPRPPPVAEAAPPALAGPLPEENSLRRAASKDGVAHGPAAPAEGPASAPTVFAPAEFARAPVAGAVMVQPAMISVPTPAARQTQVSVTLAFEVIAVQLTPLFRLDGLRLRLTGAAAAVKMADRDLTRGMALETGFRLGTAGLNANGQIETMRLIPTRQPPQLVGAESAFVVGELSMQVADARQENVRLSASESAMMHVQLTAQFELLMVELSQGFEVVTVLLKASCPTVQVSNGPVGAGAPFAIQEPQLNPLGQLETLLVRPVA